MLVIKNKEKIIGQSFEDSSGMFWQVVDVQEQQHLSSPCYEFHFDGYRKVFFVLKRLPNETSEIVEGMYCLEFFNEFKRMSDTKYLNVETIRSLKNLLLTFRELIDNHYTLPF